MATVITLDNPLKLPQGDKMIPVYLAQAGKKYGIWKSDFARAEDVEVFLLKSEKTAKQTKVFASVEIILDGRCRTLAVTKVFRH